MGVRSGRPHRLADASWLEPGLALALLTASLVVNAGEQWPYMWVVDLVCCAGASISYRWPLPGAVAVAFGLLVWLVIPAEVLPSMSGLALMINVMAAFRQSLSWRIPLAVGLGALGYLALVFRSVEDSGLHWATGIVLLLLMVLAIAAGEVWRRWRRLLELERERAEAELQAFRLELARDLHDTVAQTLSATAMRANLALGDAPSGVLRDDLEWMATECRSSAHDLRQLLGRLRGSGTHSTEAELASVDTLRTTVEAQAERLRAAGFPVVCDVGIDRLSAARAQALSAVTVEAVNNILRHAAPGTSCELNLAEDGPDVVATFRNVTGSTASRPAGMGLTGVRERLALLGGDSEVRRSGSQWELIARLPHGTEWEG